VIGQIAVWWIPLVIGTVIGVAVTRIYVDGRMNRMRGRFLREREAYLEIINKQLEEQRTLLEEAMNFQVVIGQLQMRPKLNP
jgi:uncharacterized membrane-anchored protein YhcB (DUF1043 family)